MSIPKYLLELEHFLKKYRDYVKLPIGNFGGGSFKEFDVEIQDLLISMRILDSATNRGGYQIFGKGPFEVDKVKSLLSSMGLPKGYEVLDYCTGIDLMKPIERNKYNLGICMDLLEHVANPFIVAENISNSLTAGALLFVSVPWVWEVHEFPIDNWRFTTNGLATLFPKMEVLEAKYARNRTPSELLPREGVITVFKKN